MGYETKLIIGITTFNEGKDNYFMKYAEVDLCKVAWFNDLNDLETHNLEEGTSWYFYSEDDNVINEDDYGRKLTPLPLMYYITKLKESMEHSDYRRFKWALALLEAMDIDSEPKYVIAYGH